MCACLCKSGYADAVLSEDSDVLCYGSPCLLCKVGKGKVTIICIDDVLEGLDMEMASFLDLCILLGTDYNSRTSLDKGGKPQHIGMKKALALIREHKSIESLEPLLLDPQVLNYKKCRELFQTQEIVADVKRREPNVDAAREFCAQNDIRDFYVDRLLRTLEPRIEIDT